MTTDCWPAGQSDSQPQSHASQKALNDDVTLRLLPSSFLVGFVVSLAFDFLLGIIVCMTNLRETLTQDIHSHMTATREYGWWCAVS